jgi:hypothetical protein
MNDKIEATQHKVSAAMAETKPSEPSGSSSKKPVRREEFCGTLNDGSIFETIYSPSNQSSCIFLLRKPTGDITKELSVEQGGVTVYPPLRQIRKLQRQVVLLPSAAEPYESSMDLLRSIIGFIEKYAYLDEYNRSLMAHYCMFTYTWQAWAAVPYLRFKGQPGTGKSRCLKIMKHLCYRSLDMGVSPTNAALFRSIDQVAGTTIIDEADYSEDLKTELMQMLNKGYETGSTITRCNKEDSGNYDPEPYRISGPKILANRHDFKDSALETRCLTINTISTRAGDSIPSQYPAEFYTEANQLRNKLVQWRFDVLGSLNTDETDLFELEGRARQISLPLYAISPDPQFRSELIKNMRIRSDDLREDDPSRIVLSAIAMDQIKEGTEVRLSVLKERATEIARRQDLHDSVFGSKKVAIWFVDLALQWRHAILEEWS